jgi:hypothetical protein
MRPSMIAVGALLSVVPGFAQNVISNDAMKNAVERTYTISNLGEGNGTWVFKAPGLKPVFNPAKVFESKTCAIPLLITTGKLTHDPIARARVNPAIDPKMAVPPRVPACPSPLKQR